MRKGRMRKRRVEGGGRGQEFRGGGKGGSILDSLEEMEKEYEKE